jgi:hypothetical protein
MTKFSKDEGREESPAPQDGVHRTRFSGKRNRDERGLHCPKCWCPDLPVAYTRDRIGGKRRRRRCRNCGEEMWTMEEQPAA